MRGELSKRGLEMDGPKEVLVARLEDSNKKRRATAETFNLVDSDVDG